MGDEHLLITTIRNAIVGLARKDAGRFVEFLRRECASDLMTVHLLLLEGLAEVAASHPVALVEYFCGDRRRMSVGYPLDHVEGTLRCLAGASLTMGAREQQELADVFRAWTPVDALPDKWDAQARFHHLQTVRRHRLRLCLCLDVHKLDTRTQARIEEEQRAFPEVKRPDRPMQRSRSHHTLQPVSSRMQAPHMEKASDREILGYFEDLADETEWRHPHRWLEGGSIEASRELAKLAEKDPARGLRLAESLAKITHQRPVAMVIEAAAKSAYESSALLAFIEKCESLGFDAPHYRVYVSNALESIAMRPGGLGLPVATCNMLRSWLNHDDRAEHDEDHAAEVSRRPGRILYQMGVGHALPEGNYPALRALAAGLLNRAAPQFDQWLEILEEHLLRREQPRVWQALAYHDLRFVAYADRARATALLTSVLERFPELLDVRQGLQFLDQAQHWLPRELTRTWLLALFARGTPWHAQVFGELLVLRVFRCPEDTWARDEIERFVSAPDLSDPRAMPARSGVAFMSAHLMLEDADLDLAGNWLVRLAETEHEAVSSAVLSVFSYGNTPPYDATTGALLAALEKHPFHLQGGHLDGLLQALHSYADKVPERVARIAATLMGGAGRGHASDLVDLALTLQDIPGQMESGLDLFEQLQELGLYEVEQVLDERDAPTGLQQIRSSGVRRARRRPQRRRG